MDDERMNDAERNRNKAELRSRVLETSDDEYRRSLLKHRLLYVWIIVAILVIVLGLLAYWIYRRNIRHFDGCKVTKSMQLGMTGTYEYEPYMDNVVFYGKNGISYLNASGEVVWTKAYEMTKPIIQKSGKFVAVADQGSSTIVICDDTGWQGTVTTELPISRIALADQGMVAAVVEGEVANYIHFYNKVGTKLNIDIKTVISGDGYPLAIDLSPSGETLMVSNVSVEGEGVKNKILFYNFAVGQDHVDKLIGGFEHYEDTLIPRVHFFNNKSAVAVGQDCITFYRFPKENTVEIAREYRIKKEEKKTAGAENAEANAETEEDKNEYMISNSLIAPEIRSVVANDSYIGFVFSEEAREASRHLVVYDTAGKKAADVAFDMDYDRIAFSEENEEILIYNRSSLAVYYFDGSVKFKQSMENNYDIVLSGDDKNQYYSVGNDVFQVLTPYLSD